MSASTVFQLLQKGVQNGGFDMLILAQVWFRLYIHIQITANNTYRETHINCADLPERGQCVLLLFWK